MKISKKRINNIEPILSLIGNRNFYAFAYCDESVLQKLGFKRFEVGEKIVPNIIGPVSRFNKKGKEIIDKTKKEKVVHSMYYNIKDWYGTPHSGFYDREFVRWKRNHLPALNEKIAIYEKEKEYYKISTVLLSSKESKERIKIVLNLMLEINGRIEIVDENHERIIPTKRVPWKILPPGDMPWDKYYSKIQEKLRNYDKKEIKLVKERYEFLNTLNPDSIICGDDGFSGYFIAKFSDNLYICDSIFLGNAIYVLDADWEQISKLTKKEIIRNDLAKERIVHIGNWKNRVIKSLNKNFRLI